MQPRFSLLAALAALLATGCDQLTLTPAQEPTSVRITPDTVITAEGDPIEFVVTALDQNRNPIDRLPPWAGVWTSSSPDVADVTSWTAGSAGAAELTAQIGSLRARGTVLVNPTSINARVVDAYMVQTIQRSDGSVPLIADREAILRVFAEVDAVSFFRPGIEASFYVDGAEVGRVRGEMDWGFVPQEMEEGRLQGSWALEVAAEWIQEGLTYRIALDPDGELPLVSRDGATFPATEGVAEARVEAVRDFEIVFVPIVTGDGRTGAVSTREASAYMDHLRELFPIARMTYEVREPLATSGTAGSGEEWSGILWELMLARLIEDDPRYYYGVVYQRTGGIVGMGYIGFPASIGWDNPRNGSGPLDGRVSAAAGTFAHEIGHNLGRRHAPCGGPAGIDGSFPHAGGMIGYYGMIVRDRTIVPRHANDLMGYCSDNWISDYTFEEALAFRQNLEAERQQWRPADQRTGGDGLLVWGAIDGDEVTIDPALRVTGASAPPEGEGDPVIVEGVDRDGVLLFRRTVRGYPVATHGEDGRRAMFVTLVPSERFDLDRLHRIGVVTETGRAERESRLPPSTGLDALRADPAAPRIVSGDRTGSVLHWDAVRYPLIVVRDAESGRVLQFARSGSARLPADLDGVVLEVSDGVRSVTIAGGEVR